MTLSYFLSPCTSAIMYLLMMTSSNGNIFRVTGPLCGEFTGPGEFSAQRPVTRSFDVSLICARINDWVNNREAGDLRRYRGHYDVIVMLRGDLTWDSPILASQGAAPNAWSHDDIIKWKLFPHHWPFVRGIHRWPVKSPHTKARSFGVFLIWAWMNAWVNNREAGDLRRHQAHYHSNVSLNIYLPGCCSLYMCFLKVFTWWRHDMDMLSTLIAICEGIQWVFFPHKRSVRRNLNFFFDVCMKKLELLVIPWRLFHSVDF